METDPTDQYVYLKNVTGSVEQFNEALEKLMRNLTNTAASGDSRRKYATGSASAPDFQTIVGNVQCTPDLSKDECTNCLNEAVSQIPGCCSGMVGGNIVKPSCRVRFDPHIFYGPTLPLDPDAPSPNNTFSRGTSFFSSIVIFKVFLFFIFIFIFYILKFR